MKRVGKKGEGRFARISWDEALATIATRFAEIARSDGRAAGDCAVQLCGNDGPAAGVVDGPPVLPPPWRVAARPHDLRIRRKGGLGRRHRRVGGHGRRAIRAQPPDRHLGQQRGDVQPALLDTRAGGQAPRREADRHRSLPQRHRGEMPRAHRAAAGNRRRAGAGRDARPDRGRPARPRLYRPVHARIRGTCGARRRVDAATRRANLRHRGCAGHRACARPRHHQARRHSRQLRHAARPGRRQRGPRHCVPAGAGRRLAPSRGRRTSLVVGNVSRR